MIATPSGQRWSLRRRLALWISLAAVVPMGSAILLGGLYLDFVIAGHLDTWIEDELAEGLIRIGPGRARAAELEAMAAEATAEHPTMPMAWRATHANGDIIGIHGSPDLLAKAPGSLAPGPDAISLGDGILARAAPFSDGGRLELLIDGSGQLGALEHYWVVAVLLFLAFGTVALVASNVMARRVASLVRRVADQVGQSEIARGETKLRAEGAPEEILDVVEALQAELNRLRQESASIRIFTAGLAHELRSPIQNMAGETEVVLLRRRSIEEYETTLRSQLDEIRSFGDAVDNLLTICTMKEGVHGETEEFDLAAEARIRLGREGTRAERAEVEFALHAHGQTRIAGDRESILRSLRNVVSNAIDWTPSGGRVSLAIEGQPDEVVVTVDDAGPGIPEEERQRVFEPFARGRAPGHARIGYGLGLAIAKAGVEGQGGKIEVSVSPAGGARLVMTLPRRLRR